MQSQSDTPILDKNYDDHDDTKSGISIGCSSITNIKNLNSKLDKIIDNS